MEKKFNPWPYGIVAFFVLLVCTLAAVVGIASTHRESMVTEDYYESGLQYQDRIDNTVRAEQSGARIQVDTAGRKLLVRVPAQQVGNTLSGQVDLYRPSSPDLDRQFPLQPDATGCQTMDTSKLASGLWEVHVKWNASGKGYYLEQRITL